MNTETHRQIANDIWSICNLLRGPYKRNEYRKVILPLTVLRRFDCLLSPTKAKALETFNQYKGKPESIIRNVMRTATGINSLLDDSANLAPNLKSYIGELDQDSVVKESLTTAADEKATKPSCLASR